MAALRYSDLVSNRDAHVEHELAWKRPPERPADRERRHHAGDKREPSPPVRGDDHVGQAFMDERPPPATASTAATLGTVLLAGVTARTRSHALWRAPAAGTPGSVLRFYLRSYFTPGNIRDLAAPTHERMNACGSSFGTLFGYRR